MRKHIFGAPGSPQALKVKFYFFGNYQAGIGNKTYFLKNVFWSLQTFCLWLQMIINDKTRLEEVSEAMKKLKNSLK